MAFRIQGVRAEIHIIGPNNSFLDLFEKILILELFKHLTPEHWPHIDNPVFAESRQCHCLFSLLCKYFTMQNRGKQAPCSPCYFPAALSGCMATLTGRPHSLKEDILMTLSGSGTPGPGERLPGSPHQQLGPVPQEFPGANVAVPIFLQGLDHCIDTLDVILVRVDRRYRGPDHRL